MMATRKNDVIPVRLPPKLRARVLKIAKQENLRRGIKAKKYHGIGRAAEMLISLGLPEYERQQAAVKEGRECP